MIRSACIAALVLASLALPLNAVPAVSTTYHVSPNGNDANTGAADSPLRNIQTAIDASAPGGIVKVAAGTYVENLVLPNVVLKGGYDESFDEGTRNIFLNKTILKPASGTVITDNGGSSIDGFIVDGRSGANTGIYAAAGVHSVITHNIVYGFMLSFGPGIHVEAGASAEVKNNSVHGNRLSGGGTIFYGIYIEGNLNNATIVRNNISSNNDVGISIAVSGVSTGYNCVYGSKYFDYSGTFGAAAPFDVDKDPLYINPLTLDFRLKGTSPCIDAGDPADPVGFEPLDNGGRINMGSYGGTIAATQTGVNRTVHVSNAGDDGNDGSAQNPFRTIQYATGNATGDTVKVMAGTYSESIIMTSRVILRGGYTSSFREEDRDIFANQTTVRGMGTIMLTDDHASTIDGFIFDGMDIPTEAVIKATGASIITHNVIKEAGSAFAAGVSVVGGAQVINNTIVYCSYGIEINSGGTGAPAIRNNILTHNSFAMVTNGFSELVRTYNNFYANSFNYTGSDSDPGTGDIALDPKYVDLNTGDFRITDSSPCVNAGDPADPVGDEPEPNGGRIDMGAYGGTKHTPYRETQAEPSAQPTDLVFTSVTASSLVVNFQVATGFPTGYLILRKAGSAPAATPADGTSYSAGETLGDAVVAYSGSAYSVNQTGLSSGTEYYFEIYSYNGSGTARDYLVTGPLSGSVSTSASEPTGQPSSMTFGAITSVSMNVSFSASSPASSGYLAIRKAGSSATGVPVDRTAYSAGTPIGDGVVAYSGNATSFDNTGLSPSTVYHYTIYSYNGDNGTINYRQASPLTGSQTTLEASSDNTPPSVTLNSTPQTVAVNTALSVSANFQDDDSGISSAKIQYRPVTAAPGTAFTTADMTFTTGSTYTYSIPASVVKDLGVDYRFLLQDNAGNTNSASQTLYTARISHAGGMTIPYASPGVSAANYRIIAIPLQLEDQTAEGVFLDWLGAYDPTFWRMFHWTGSSYTELDGSSELTPGKGYWFITPTSTTLNTGPGVTLDVSSENPFTLTLSPGWNQIGNPYPFDISWSDVIAANPDDAAFLGNNSKARVFRTSVQDVDEITAFEGAFVKNTNTSAITIDIPVYKNPSVNGRKATDDIVRNTLDADEWDLRFHLEAGGMTYDLGGIGMRPAANEAFDFFDDFNLPRFLDYLEIRFPKEHLGMTYTRDVVPTVPNHAWEFTVETNKEDRHAELRWDNSYFGHNRVIILTDPAGAGFVDMRSEEKYMFPVAGSRKFRILFGDDTFVRRELGKQILLNVPYRESSSSHYVIPYWIAESAGRATLGIFDTSGRVIASYQLSATSTPAYLYWEGSCPEGIYVVRLTTGQQSVMRKFIKK